MDFKIYLVVFFIFFHFNYAFSNNLFETEIFNIKFESTNIEETKKSKIDEIKNQSFNKILKNLLIKKDYIKITRNKDKGFSDKFILNILINDEKIINDIYSANIKVNFNKNSIIEFLRSNKINYVEFIPDDFLTIILEETEINENLFSQKNLYYNFLKNNNNLIYDFYFLPKLDINDRFLVSKDDIINLNYINLKKISDKYDKKNILIIHFKSNSKVVNYRVYLNNENSIELLLNSSDKNFNLDSFFTDIIPIVKNHWKINNLISTSTFTTLECTIKTLNIYELKNIKNLLNSSTLINEIILKTISLNSNSYFVNYYGNEFMLINSLNRKNINISIENNICNISLK